MNCALQFSAHQVINDLPNFTRSSIKNFADKNFKEAVLFAPNIISEIVGVKLLMVGPCDGASKLLRETDGERFVLDEESCEFPKEF
jgi:hypothetical protein